MKEGTLTSAITASEFAVASTLRGNMRSDADPSGGIDLFDFTLMELYRLRKTDEEEIKEIWENFHTLDADGNGIFTRSEMQAALAFAKHDKDGVCMPPSLFYLLHYMSQRKIFLTQICKII